MMEMDFTCSRLTFVIAQALVKSLREYTKPKKSYSLKEIVLPKLILHPFATHNIVDGGSGDVSSSV